MGLFSKLFQKKEEKPVVQERSPLNIQVGDIIEYDLHDYEVVGKITYRQDSYEWIAYQLLEGDNIRWLSAEMDDELEMGIYETIQLPVSQPFPRKLIYENRTFYLEEEGEARVVGEGRSKNINGRIAPFADYSDDTEEHFLSVEGWGSEFEVSYGYPIEDYEIKIIAGSI